MDLQEGRVVMFLIPAAPQGIPVAWEGHYYGRDAEDLVPLNLEELERIRSQATRVDWSAAVCDDATIDDLDPAALTKARDEYGKKFPLKENELQHWNDTTFLNKAKVTLNGKITNVALLLLGKEESRHLLLPYFAQITWVLKDEHDMEKDYTHFSIPLILTSDKVLKKIRNLNYRYLPDNTLFPIEITQYDPYVIREALHNCIAHQDYTLKERINLVESPDYLIFENGGSFLPETVERVIEQDAPQRYYRNKFLCDAMVNLNMIDTIGSGIKKMFLYQRNRFFPLPGYDLSKPDAVKVKIIGKVIDRNYTQLLMDDAAIPLKEVILLDRVQKKEPISDEEAKILKEEKLIEGRKPNYFVAARIAGATGGKASYIKNKAFDDEHYKRMISAFIEKYGSATRQEINDLLLSKLSDVLNEKQEISKIGNLLTAMRMDGLIENVGSFSKSKWVRIKRN